MRHPANHDPAVQMLYCVIVRQFMASHLLHVFGRHASPQKQPARIIEPAGRYHRFDIGDITADGHHVELVLAPAPEAGSTREVFQFVDCGLERKSLRRDAFFRNSGEPGEEWRNCVGLATPVERLDEEPLGTKDLKIILKAELDRADLDDDGIGVEWTAPEVAL